MNLDEYTQEAQSHASDDQVAILVKHIVSWKSDGGTVLEPANTVERLFGNLWIENKETHNSLYLLWSEFNKVAIIGIGGMTMNERLYLFGLSDRFEHGNEEEKNNIYTKLLASK